MSAETRIDVDYSPHDDDMRMLLKGLHRMLDRPSGSSYQEEGGGENKRWLAWILTVTSLVAVSGICGGVVVYGRISSLEATVTQWQISIDRMQAQFDRRLDRLEQRP